MSADVIACRCGACVPRVVYVYRPWTSITGAAGFEVWGKWKVRWKALNPEPTEWPAGLM